MDFKRVKRVEISLPHGEINNAKLVGLGLAVAWPARDIRLLGGKICLELAELSAIRKDGENNSVEFYNGDDFVFKAEMVACYKRNGWEIVETKNDQLVVLFFANP